MSYAFDPEILHQIAIDSIGKNESIRPLIDKTITELSIRYPRHINPSPEWVFNNAGGAMGVFAVLHASVTEYVIIFGTPIGTEGHTGRHSAEDYFMILDGEQWAFSAGQFEREIYRPGDVHYLPRGCAKQYRIPEACWALEYARGFIPAMLPFGLADTFTSTLDFRSLAQTLWIYTKSTMQELRQGKI